MKPDKIRRTGGNGRRSTCVSYNGLLYISGITTVDIHADITGQTKDVLAQIDKLLDYHNTDKHNVLQANVVFQYMEDYGGLNQAWDEWVDDEYEPTRTVVCAQLALPEFRVMVSVVAAEGV